MAWRGRGNEARLFPSRWPSRTRDESDGMKAQTTAILVSLIAVLIVLAAVVLRDLPNPQTQSSSPPPPQPPGPSTPCKESGGSGFALCVRANVTRVIDGDTIVIGFDSDRDGVDEHVRLVLVDAPALHHTRAPERNPHPQPP